MNKLQRVLVLSGVSGSGKTTAVHVLEDLGFFCMDNVPVSLLESVISLCADNEEIHNVSLVIDAREGSFLENVGKTLDVINQNYPLKIIWLDAQNDAVLKRFQMTKRRHPLGENVRNAIAEERQLLAEVAGRATDRVDTTHLSPHELSLEIRNLVAPDEGSGFRIRLCSFGFRHGVPIDVDQILDVRFLPNPYWNESLRHLNGLDEPIRKFMEEADEIGRYLTVAEPFIRQAADLASEAGKPFMSIAIGCTGGQHRSVYVTERIAEAMKASGISVSVEHRNLPDANT